MTTDSTPILTAVDEALRGLSQDARDSGAVALIRAYALTIDADPEQLSDLGPKLLAGLTALGLTPAARNAKGGTADGNAGAGKLDELRERRAARARVDAA